ncbi:hypothetical protein O1611_g9587 [Lasiodiplodia mahajangana]|uniref:Uncharacterized protein n=1 Tax=Lasiodiplodia mahajangana TaxID=1108764 RepID=A0ACC2J7S0_9PEZI|nr:hypothetical protein O1611_g9587 [Lasiodiplodia mahajangana]
MPKARKRAGTPIRGGSKRVRHSDDEPSSEIGIVNDASTGVGMNDGEETPRPKARARRTPKKSSTNASIPSSQASNRTTGRKRGRPRKVPIPDESTMLTGTEPETSNVTKSSAPDLESSRQNAVDKSPSIERDALMSDNVDHAHAPSSPPPGRVTTASPLRFNSFQDQARINRSSSSPVSSHQELADNDGFMMEEEYQGTEPQSDLLSAVSEDGMTHHRQDTIADASEFSMIAVESLPSFQASFQASFYEDGGQPASDQPEMGEETSRIVSRTLDSLRRSLQTETESPSHMAEPENNSNVEDQDQDQDRDEMRDQSTVSTEYGSGRAFAKSPRRLKPLPLSRKVFIGRGNVDDSFSSIPDSILHAATPRRPHMMSTAGEQGPHGEEDGAYEDSFSEVPAAVLEAATPRPARRIETLTHESSPRDEEITRSTGRRSSADYGSNRLPTPEETSSSNAESKREQEEELGLEPQEEPDSVHPVDVPSSPPIITRPRAIDFGYSNLQRELGAVKERRSSSPQRHLPGNTTSNQLQSLEAPLPIARPSLSPIVRAGRTLQNVMSDNSSPEDRGVNLGSPFKGSMSHDQLRQSSAARSPSPSIRKRGVPNKSYLSNGSPSRLEQSFRPKFDQRFGHAPQSSGDFGDSFGQNNVTHSRIESLRDSVRHQPSEPAPLIHGPSVTGPTRADLTIAEDESSWAPYDNTSQRINRQQPSFQTGGSHNQSADKAKSTDISQVATADDAGSHLNRSQHRRNKSADDTDLYSNHDQHHRSQSSPKMGSDRSDGLADHVDDDDNDDVDIWDIEASRTSPGKPEPARTASRSLKPDVPSSRKSKVPSPWRRNNRRLIYKDDIASSSQIEIEESSQSEVEQYPPIRSRQRPLAPQREQDTRKRAPSPEPVREIQIQEELYDQRESSPPNLSYDDRDDFEQPMGLADSDEFEEPSAPEQPQDALDLMDEDRDENETQDEAEDIEMPPAPKVSVDVSEYSLVAQQSKQTPKLPEKPAQSKSRFFGGFDILSFFSSPATLPRNKSSGPNPPGPVNNLGNTQPTRETIQQREPPKAIWSTGLFPSLPQKEPQPNSERRTNVFRPSSALPSTDTIADTYEPSTSVSPPQSRLRSESAAPSTPERQVFPPIQQKQNFTPRPGQAGGSLFAPNQANSSVLQDEFSDTFEESSDEQDSALTETSEYERVPPREKPSKWDRNLSPTKSCFRSPLKPTTPGRLVAFSNSALSPLAQMKTNPNSRQPRRRSGSHTPPLHLQPP